MSYGTFWGVIAPDNPGLQRAGLDLGLRAALLHYGELSVPGIGSTRFVRQLVWPCLAVALKDDQALRVSTARLATAIEALACKLWIDGHADATPADRGGRIAGVRRLPGCGLSFRDLGQPQGYVSNPMRRGATRALPEQGGLGFATGGQRLDRMTLTRRGEDLVNGSRNTNIWHNRTLRQWLPSWVAGEEAANIGNAARKHLLEALGPFPAATHDRQVVLAALMRDNGGGQRRRLIETLLAPELPRELDAYTAAALLRRLPAADAGSMNTAWAFRRLVTTAQFAIRRTAQFLRVPGATPALADVIQGDVLDALRGACNQARKFLDSINGTAPPGPQDAVEFARVLADAENVSAAAELVRRADPLLGLDGDRLIRGPAFSERWLQAGDENDDADDAAATDAAAPGDLPPRLSGLLSLLHDCQGA